MTLYLIGIGLADEKDITLKGLEAVKSCDYIYLEHYTSILGVDKNKLESLYGKEVIVASRDLVEKEAEEKLINPAKEKNVALLVVGDIFGATTHSDLMLRAKEEDVKVVPIFNVSVLNAVGIVGLELYKYGKTTSIVFPDDDWYPSTPYDVIKQNKSLGLHTLCLLDIKVAEPSKEELLKSARDPNYVPKTMPPRYMTVKQGLEVLIHIEDEKKEGVILKDDFAIGVARLGHDDFKIVAAPIEELLNVDFGAPLHSIIIPGTLHHIEEESLSMWK
ncbi:diphthine synthase [Candidatus Woesearchaeota archaeon]|nr:diphthine synthase [Candidatus Woesearchaeota archaeon]